MAKHHHHRRHHARRRNPRRRNRHHYAARRRNRISYVARSRNPFRRHHHRRRRNPSFVSSQIFGLAGGAIVAGLGCRIIPDMLVPSYNEGWTGYGIDAVTGVLISRFGLRYISRDWETGGYVGTILSVVSRIASEKLGSTLFGNGTDGMSYYMDSPFPWRGDPSQGPYPQFPGGRYALPAPVPTAATAVQAGQAASAAVQAAAAAPAAGMAPGASAGKPGGWKSGWRS